MHYVSLYQLLASYIRKVGNLYISLEKNPFDCNHVVSFYILEKILLKEILQLLSSVFW